MLNWKQLTFQLLANANMRYLQDFKVKSLLEQLGA